MKNPDTQSRIGALSGPLIREDGTVRKGLFGAPIGPIHYRDYRLKSPLGALLPEERRESDFKGFQFLGAVSARFALGCAVTYSAALKSAFLYIFDFSENRFVLERRFGARHGDECHFALDPDAGESLFRFGENRIVMRAEKEALSKALEVRLDDGTAISLSFSENRPGFETLRLCTQTGAAGWTYAQKVAGVIGEGEASGSFGQYDFAVLGACAHHDYTAGFLRPETYWNWACFSGRVADGTLLGLNVSNGVNETGQTENCFWVNGAMVKCDHVMIDFDDENLDAPWRIYSQDGKADLTFTPAGGYHATGESGEIASNFHQMFGFFNGVLKDEDGKAYEIEAMPGFTETQYLRW